MKAQNTSDSTKKRTLPKAAEPYKWQKGQSGNPGGRPKRDKAKEIAEMIFESAPEDIMKAMLKALKKGNPKVFSALADRAYGKPPQSIEWQGDGPTINVNVRYSK